MLQRGRSRAKDFSRPNRPRFPVIALSTAAGGCMLKAAAVSQTNDRRARQTVAFSNSRLLTK
jgi:hypothetical protein